MRLWWRMPNSGTHSVLNDFLNATPEAITMPPKLWLRLIMPSNQMRRGRNCRDVNNVSMDRDGIEMSRCCLWDHDGRRTVRQRHVERREAQLCLELETPGITIGTSIPWKNYMNAQDSGKFSSSIMPDLIQQQSLPWIGVDRQKMGSISCFNNRFVSPKRRHEVQVAWDSMAQNETNHIRRMPRRVV